MSCFVSFPQSICISPTDSVMNPVWDVMYRFISGNRAKKLPGGRGQWPWSIKASACQGHTLHSLPRTSSLVRPSCPLYSHSCRLRFLALLLSNTLTSQPLGRCMMPPPAQSCMLLTLLIIDSAVAPFLTRILAHRRRKILTSVMYVLKPNQYRCCNSRWK